MKTVKISLLLLSVIFLSSCNTGDDGPSTTEQLQKEIAVIDEFLTNRDITPIVDGSSGIRMDLKVLGTGGLPPKATSKVKVVYKTKDLDGHVFDLGTFDRTFESTIPGWQAAMYLMPAGTKANFYVPSIYGYGPDGYGAVPGNTTLVLELELQKVYVTATELTQLASDSVKIDDYIEENEIQNAVKDSTGLRYVITTEGTGPSPTWYDMVKIKYSGKILVNGTTLEAEPFTTGTLEPGAGIDSRIINFLFDGWKVGFQKMKKGGKATLYMPSGMGYGASSFVYSQTKTIPANSILVFEVELVDILGQ